MSLCPKKTWSAPSISMRSASHPAEVSDSVTRGSTSEDVVEAGRSGDLPGADKWSPPPTLAMATAVGVTCEAAQPA